MTTAPEPISSTDTHGPALSGRPLHMIWLLDVSGSMGQKGKIEALNEAMRVAVESTREAARENPSVAVTARAITFAHDAVWHIADAVPIDDLEWVDVDIVEQGTTETGKAIDLATEAIREVASAGRGLPPALILVSDGRPTDLSRPSYGAALRALARETWGRKSSRLAIGIGDDADMESLHRFIGHDELEPLTAANAADLRHYLRWASTVAVDDRSRPASDWREMQEQRAPGFDHGAGPTTDDPEAPTEPRPAVPPPVPATDQGPVW